MTTFISKLTGLLFPRKEIQLPSLGDSPISRKQSYLLSLMSVVRDSTEKIANLATLPATELLKPSKEPQETPLQAHGDFPIGFAIKDPRKPSEPVLDPISDPPTDDDLLSSPKDDLFPTENTSQDLFDSNTDENPTDLI